MQAALKEMEGIKKLPKGIVYLQCGDLALYWLYSN